ncbi:hypothetical protein SNE40_013431 [Patella caerulea]|uniref:Uncharacterized protein n=1 Tax=Patella caerulea TaxID=87958 RepID=A0AAN8JF16_PATCE
MVLFVTVVIAVLCVGINGQCDQHAATECDGYDLLPDHPLGLLLPDDIQPLCSIVTKLSSCLNASIGGCEPAKQIKWRSAILSSEYICNNLRAYRTSVACFFDEETISGMETCSDDLEYNMDEMGCGSFPEFKNCTIKVIATNCQPEAVVTMRAILAVNTAPKLDAMNCPVEETTTSSTTQKQTTSSTTQKQPTSSTRLTTMVMHSSTEGSGDVKRDDDEPETETGNVGQRNNANYHVTNFNLLIMIPQIILLSVL